MISMDRNHQRNLTRCNYLDTKGLLATSSKGLSQNVITRVRVNDMAGQRRGCVTHQTKRHVSHICDCDRAPHGSPASLLCEQLLEMVNAVAGPGLDWSRRNGVYANAFETKYG